MRSPRPSQLLTLALLPAAFSMSACKTIYSDMYSYKKNYFDARESREFETRQIEEAKKQADAARVAAERDSKSQAEKISASSDALKLDSGLGGLGGMTGMGAGSPSSIPGLGASPGGAPSMGSSIPGLDSAPSMGGGDAMGGAPAAKPATPPATPAMSLPGL